MISKRGMFVGKRFPGGYRFSPDLKRGPFAQWLCDVCEATNLSIPELAAIVDIPAPTLTKWSRNIRRPRPYMVELLVERITRRLQEEGYGDKIPPSPAR